MSTVDYRAKRLLSPGSTNVEIPEDKRLKANDSNEVEEIDTPHLNMDPEQKNEEDLKRYMDTILALVDKNGEALTHLATKQEITELNDQVTAQGTEIDQLKSEVKTLKKSIKDIEDNFDRHIAEKVNRTFQTADRQSGSRPNNMAASDKINRPNTNVKRRNLIFEGLLGDNEDEIKSNIIQLAKVIGVVLFASEIEMVVRLKRRDERDVRPGPVVATFARIVHRDGIIMKKRGLMDIEGLTQVFVNADESLQVRRAKAMLRKAAFIARTEGAGVEARHDRIRINEDIYTVDDVHTLPQKYTASKMESLGAVGGGTDAKDDEGVHMQTEQIAGPPPKPSKFVIRPGENMRISKRGLLFSGPSAFPLNLAKYPISYNDKSCDSKEQAYQWQKAVDNSEEEIAAEIKRATESFDIYYAGSDIVTSEVWKRNAPDLLAMLVIIKYEQHPELLDRLISTYPKRLIEASLSKRRGGGAPINSPVYGDLEKPLPGSNVFGDTATNYRDKKIRELYPHGF